MNKYFILFLITSFLFINSSTVQAELQEEKKKNKKEVKEEKKQKENKFCDVPDDTSVKIKSKDKIGKENNSKEKKKEE